MTASSKALFDPRFVVMAKRFAMMGCTHAQICRNLGVQRAVFQEWLDIFPEFQVACDHCKVVANYSVVEALYKRCIGFTVTTTSKRSDGETVTKEEYIAPDVTAQKFWLTNRMPELWKLDVPVKQGGGGGVPLNAREIMYPSKQPEQTPTDDASAAVKVPTKNPEGA